MPGQRHAQITRLVCMMAARRIPPTEVFGLLRPAYGADITDFEIQSLIEWSASKEFNPSTTFRVPPTSFIRRNRPPRFARQRPPKREPQQSAEEQREQSRRNAEHWLNGHRVSEADLYHASPWTPPEDCQSDAEMLLAGMYKAGELINIVSPFHRGAIRQRDEWIKLANLRRLPISPPGTWIGMNPTDGNGQGRADTNVVTFRFALLESDSLPLDLQFSLLARLPLPINAIVDSGGKSLHAWLRIDAPDSLTFRHRLKNEVFAFVKPFGFDLANGNAARLARLPGVPRTEKARRGAQGQRLLYCAPGQVAFAPIIS